MIRLVRTRSASDLAPGLYGSGREKREKALLRLWRDHLADGGEGSPAWKSQFWKDGKPQLTIESKGKCAYCETPFSVGGHGDVEHFRPKSVYWWLAYCYDNHNYSCQICNQTFKGDKFPVQATQMKGPKVTAGSADSKLDSLVGQFAPDAADSAAGLSYQDFQSACSKERPGLLDPYIDDPDGHFAWDPDDVNREVTLIPARSTARVKYVVKCCEEVLGLNREELRRRRFDVYEIARGFKMILDVPSVPAPARAIAIASLCGMESPGRAYSGMVRFFLREWNIPAH